MSIIGSKIGPKSIGISTPYIESLSYSGSGTARYISEASLNNYTVLPPYLCYFGVTYTATVDITNSPNIVDIGAYALYRCKGIQHLPSSVRRVGNSACMSTDLIDLPSSLEIIEDNAFVNCSKFTMTELPSGLKHIMYRGFYQSNIAISSLPASVQSLEGSVTSAYLSGNNFENCLNITSFTFPVSQLTKIPSCCFMDCSNLISVDISSSINTIESSVFHRCSALTTIYCRAATPPTLKSSSGFGTVSALAHIYVPSASVDAYKTKTNWTKYASKISAIPT